MALEGPTAIGGIRTVKFTLALKISATVGFREVVGVQPLLNAHDF